MNLTPKTALVERHGLQGEIPVEEVVTGDVLIVKAVRPCLWTAKSLRAAVPWTKAR